MSDNPQSQPVTQPDDPDRGLSQNVEPNPQSDPSNTGAA